MALQLIICVESSSRAGTDNIYIKETLLKYFEITKEIKISFINMGGKSKYKSSNVTSKIKQLTKDFKIGTTVVVYCFDTDNYESNHEQVKENKEIADYLAANGYELVWFCHDIEEVYLGRSIDNSEKTKRAVEFKTSGEINTVNENKLASKKIAKGKSNIMAVFGKCLKRRLL